MENKNNVFGKSLYETLYSYILTSIKKYEYH